MHNWTLWHLLFVRRLSGWAGFGEGDKNGIFWIMQGPAGRFLLNTPGLKVTEPAPCDLVLVAHIQACPSQIYFGGMGGYELIAVPLLSVQNLKYDYRGHFYVRILRPLPALLRLHVIGFFLLPPPLGLCSGLNKGHLVTHLAHFLIK